jgi:hypothetical protein
MDTGPIMGLTATISVPGDAARAAASPMVRVMDSVVFGLMTLIRMAFSFLLKTGTTLLSFPA